MFSLTDSLSKIVLTYENGKCIQLSGDDANKWLRMQRDLIAVHAMALLTADGHEHVELDKLEWEKIRDAHTDIDIREGISL